MAHHEHHSKTDIKWIASPLTSQHELSHSHDSSSKHSHSPEGSSDPENQFPARIDDAALHSTPQFRRHEEATNIELFFDLFFVANLTTFTGLHDINTRSSLEAYIGYFCILWFAWCQVIMFDVRYVTDSIIERMAKAVQFGVMVGFAVVGPNFDPSKQKHQTFKTLSLILAVSRFVLCLQYLAVMWHVKKYKGAKLPLGLIAVVNFIAAIIYLALGLSYPSGRNSNNYIAWYVVAVAETAINIAVSSRWKVVSFKGTHLVQRMSLLTLIILGEGVIVVCKSISKIVKNENSWTSATIGTLTAAVTIIYILYMIYFDWLSHKHFGSIRQQIWAFLHFPFHLALVLFMEGAAQFLIWHKIIEALDLVGNAFSSDASLLGTDSSQISDFVNAVNATTQEFIYLWPPVYATTYDEIDANLAELASTVDLETIKDATSKLLDVIQSSLLTTYGIEPPKDAVGTGVEEELAKQSDVFNLVFIYFFVTAGLTLICLNILNYLTISHKTSGKLGKITIIRLGFNTIVGITLCLLAILVTNETLGGDFAMSAWVLPTPMFCLLLVLVGIHIRTPGSGNDVHE